MNINIINNITLVVMGKIFNSVYINLF